jgi:hypothetical protein
MVNFFLSFSKTKRICRAADQAREITLLLGVGEKAAAGGECKERVGRERKQVA